LARSSGAECREYLIRNSIKIPNWPHFSLMARVRDDRLQFTI
jgi:hypothetical protein